jgi:hypothetical protein
LVGVPTEGGINGRKINFISYDDGYSPPKTVEQARKLVGVDLVEVGGFGLADDAVGELKMNRTSSLSEAGPLYGVILPILISVSVTPGPYFFWAKAVKLVAANKPRRRSRSPPIGIGV